MKVFYEVRPGDNLWWVSGEYKSVIRVTVQEWEAPYSGYKTIILRETVAYGSRGKRTKRIDVSSRYLDKPNFMYDGKNYIYSDSEILLTELQEQESKLLDELEGKYSERIDICLKDREGEDVPEGWQDIWTTLGELGLMLHSNAADSEMTRIQRDFKKMYEEIL